MKLFFWCTVVVLKKNAKQIQSIYHNNEAKAKVAEDKNIQTNTGKLHNLTGIRVKIIGKKMYPLTKIKFYFPSTGQNTSIWRQGQKNTKSCWQTNK